MAIDFSFLENAVPTTPEPEKKAETGTASVTIRVDADCFMQCDGEYIDLAFKAGVMAKTQLPIGQHLLEFFHQDNPNIKVEKVVDFPESGRNYLVMVNELKAAIAPSMPQANMQSAQKTNPFLDQLTQMAQVNPLVGMQQMPPVPPMPSTPPPFDNKK